MADRLITNGLDKRLKEIVKKSVMKKRIAHNAILVLELFYIAKVISPKNKLTYPALKS